MYLMSAYADENIFVGIEKFKGSVEHASDASTVYMYRLITVWEIGYGMLGYVDIA